MTMRVYLVRHAESQVNRARIHQHSDVPLHSRGIKQAKAVAKKLASLNIEAILSSPYARAKETAVVISTAIHKPVLFFDELVEIRRPQEMKGKVTTDPSVLSIQAELVKNFEKGAWRYSDEETFEELKARGLAALDRMLGVGKENIAAVSHAAMIRVIVACALFGKDLKPREYMGLWASKVDNTSITILEHNPESALIHPWKNPWTLITLNDCGHLH